MTDETPRSRRRTRGLGNLSGASASEPKEPSWLAGYRKSHIIEHPKPNSSILGSAVRITSKVVASSTFRRTTHETWQDDAWSMFDLVGEFRFLANTLGDRMSKARLYVGKQATLAGDAPIPVDDAQMTGLLDAIGDGRIGLSQLIKRLFINLYVPGDGWLVGIPKEKLSTSLAAMADNSEGLPPKPTPVDRTPKGPTVTNPTRTAEGDKLKEGNYTLPVLDELEWRVLSVNEITFNVGGDVRILLGPTHEEIIECSPDELYLIRVWRPHPRYWWHADSPTRASLPVLRELVGLTMHVSAQIDSRLAGAGILLVPSSASIALKRAMGLPDDSDEDPFTDALIQSMITPIGDRSNASAIVPLVITVPDDTVAEFKFLDFSKELDSEAQNLREEAIRRLALGQDAPPELLLGQTDANHWGAWLTAEEVVSAHIEPPLALMCDALTTQYLRPILIENGVPKDIAEQYMVWYDVDDLIVRPNKTGDAQALYAAGELSGTALRAANGFDESDAPYAGTLDRSAMESKAIAAVAVMVEANPGLMQRPGLDVMFDQMMALYQGNPMQAVGSNTPAPPTAAVANAQATVAQGGAGPQQPGQQPGPAQPAAPATPAVPISQPQPQPQGAPGFQPRPTGAMPPGGVPQGGVQPMPTNPAAAAAQSDAATRFAEVGAYSRRTGVRGSLSQHLAELDAELEKETRARSKVTDFDATVLDQTGFEGE